MTNETPAPSAVLSSEPNPWTDEDVDTDAHILALSRWIDGSYPPETDVETRLWRRIAKVGEEHGEVISALIGAVGENPRKGYTHSYGDVERELFDVALCALAAITHLRDTNLTIRGSVMEGLRDHAFCIAERAGVLPAQASEVSR